MVAFIIIPNNTILYNNIDEWHIDYDFRLHLLLIWILDTQFVLSCQKEILMDQDCNQTTCSNAILSQGRQRTQQYKQERCFYIHIYQVQPTPGTRTSEKNKGLIPMVIKAMMCT